MREFMTDIGSFITIVKICVCDPKDAECAILSRVCIDLTIPEFATHSTFNDGVRDIYGDLY